ncbi:MAG: CopD family protein, partial [Flavobacteriaceae bacterium]
MYLYIKALHIVFVVTWFAGLFYMVRLFVYHTEAKAKPEPEQSILIKQYQLMQGRLWNI